MAMVMATAMTITGEDNNNNRQGWQQQWARTTKMASRTTPRMTATTARTTGEDGEDDRGG